MTKQKPTQTELAEFVDNHIHRNQTMLVSDMLDEGKINFEDIENYYPEWKLDEKGECTICREEEKQGLNEHEICAECWDQEKYEYPNEVFEWWLVSDWLLRQLEQEGEPILKTDYENWWGRTTTGQAIKLDWVIEQIYKKTI